MLRLIVVVAVAWSIALAPCLPGAVAAEDKVRIAELSPEAELAIDKGLQYLANTQNPEGSWGNEHKAGVTALSLMAFMLKGHFPKKGPYGPHLEKGVAFLIQRSRDGGGYFGGSMYEHGLATLALSEVWGMTQRQEIRDTLKRAVEVIIRAQHPSGGWRYKPTPFDQDISVTVMQVVALASAQEAGILVPAEVMQKAMEYVKRCQQRDGGFAYQMGGGQSEFARSAAGCMALIMGGQRSSPELQRGLDYLRKRGEGGVFQHAPHYAYGHYYAMQVMYQAGESHYQAWYPRIRDALLAKQRRDGSWSAEMGTQYSTAMAILVLGVPYRYLPIYQR